MFSIYLALACWYDTENWNWTSFSLTATQGTPPNCCVLMGSMAYSFNHMRLYILVYFKSWCLRVWLLVSLKLGAEIFLGHWLILAQSQILGDSKNITECLDNHGDLRDSQELRQDWMTELISFMRLPLQDWERWLSYLLDGNQLKESSKMNKWRKRNMFQIKEQDKTSGKNYKWR